MSLLYLSDVSSTLWNASIHLALEALVHFVLFPEVAVAILHPLEVRRGDAAGVGEDVGNDEDAALAEMLSASGVVGPLAPSAMIFALIFGRVLRW